MWKELLPNTNTRIKRLNIIQSVHDTWCCGHCYQITFITYLVIIVSALDFNLVQCKLIIVHLQLKIFNMHEIITIKKGSDNIMKHWTLISTTWHTTVYCSIYVTCKTINVVCMLTLNLFNQLICDVVRLLVSCDIRIIFLSTVTHCTLRFISVVHLWVIFSCSLLIVKLCSWILYFAKFVWTNQLLHRSILLHEMVAW